MQAGGNAPSEAATSYYMTSTAKEGSNATGAMEEKPGRAKDNVAASGWLDR
jgi:hypothetical protein